MAEAWVYIDESQAPSAVGVEDGRPFQLAALLVEEPISSKLTEGAMASLRQDPDAGVDPIDARTFARGYFHASEDSKNGHSWLCRAIVEAPINGHIFVERWFFGRDKGDEYEGAKLHRLFVLLSIGAAVFGNYDAIHICLASRQGTFDEAHLREWHEYFLTTLLRGSMENPGFPTRFPRLDVQLADGREPGIQVVDFILWAVQRADYVTLKPAGKSDWARRLKLNVTSDGGIVDHAHQFLHGEVGKPVHRHELPPVLGGVPARDPSSLNDGEKWTLLREIAADVHRAARVVAGNSRIGHFAETLREATAPSRASGWKTEEELLAALNLLLEAFLLVCDTLPLYDLTDPTVRTRTTEKRALAGAFLVKGLRLWVPLDGTLAE